MDKKQLPTFEHEGVTVKPTKKGLYYCPFDCPHDERYPRPSWKTERGIRKHLSECVCTPSGKKLIEEQKEKERMAEQKRKEKAGEPKYKIGDSFFAVTYRVVKPTHEKRNGRDVRVRYEPVLEYTAGHFTVLSVVWNGYRYFYNNQDFEGFFDTGEEAEEYARKLQKKHEQQLKEAARNR